MLFRSRFTGQPVTVFATLPWDSRLIYFDFLWSIRDTGTDREWCDRPQPSLFLGGGYVEPLWLPRRAVLGGGTSLFANIDPFLSLTDAGAIRAGHVVLATDAWTAKILRTIDIELPMMVTREQLSYFPHVDLERFGAGRLPVWIWMDDPCFYGFPVYGDPTAVKAAEDCGGPEVDADTRTFEPDPAMQQKLASFMDDMFGPGFGAPRSATCLYAMTSDRDFLLDTLPGLPQVSAALGTGHGFKFAAWFGQQLAALACGEPAGADIAPFSFSRPSLHQPIDRASWMV